MYGQLNIEKKHSSPYHPEGDGMAERAKETVRTTIRCVLQEENVSKYRWPDFLQQVAFLFNALKCSSTGLTPYEAMYGEKPVLPLTIIQSSTEGTTTIKEREYVEEPKFTMQKKNKKCCEDDFVFVKNQRRGGSTVPGPIESNLETRT